MVSQAEADVILYKTAGAKGGQATLCEKCASDAGSCAGLSEDTCAVQGYTVPAGDQVRNVPVIGSIKVELFAKAAMVSQAEADVVLYKITGAKCGQATWARSTPWLRSVSLPRLGAFAPLRAARAGRTPDVTRAGFRVDQG